MKNKHNPYVVSISYLAFIIAILFSLYLFEKQRRQDQRCILQANQATLIKGAQLEGFPQPSGYIAELAYSHYFKKMGTEEFSEYVYTNCQKGGIK